jgi:opacity protein-like surface antigen
MTLTKFAWMSAVAAGALAVGGQADAADIYAGSGGPVYAAAPAWTGFYIGAHVGGVWTDLRTTDVDGAWGNPGDQFYNTTAGILGGGQVGYNFQYGSFVFGTEADFGGLGVSNNQTAFGKGSGYFSRLDDGFYTDVTGRLGYAAGPALLYVKGGWAYFDGSVSINDTVKHYAASVSGLDGWTFGGGIEYKLSPSWSVKGEYRLFDFGSVTETLYPAGVCGTASGYCRFDHAFTADSVTVGLNYIWGSSFYSPLK